MELDTANVRKKWMKCWNAMMGYHLITGTLLLATWILGGCAETGEDYAGVWLSFWAMFWLFLCRKYAYDNSGTKLLTFILVTSGLNLLRNLSKLGEFSVDLYSLADYGIFMTIFVWFAIRSLKLLELNKKINKKTKAELQKTPANE